MTDYPGQNSDARQKAISFAVQACPLFTPSRHKNTYARTNGALSICTQCGKPQHQHWLRQLLGESTRSIGVERIAAERQRQIEREGWSAAHDDTHSRSQMVVAACRYALHDANKPTALKAVARMWRWSSCWFKPSSDPIRNLTKAGALIAAEIDRLQRKADPLSSPVRGETKG